MTERPILFAGSMVRALLDGRKTQTRRPCKPMNAWVKQDCREVRHIDGVPHHFLLGAEQPIERLRSPYGQPGDRLWVRETWLPDPPHDGTWASTQFSGCENSPLTDIPERFRTPEHCIFREGWSGPDLRWKPSIHMPRWASRILLEVTSVRVERLQAIDHDDAREEGIFNSATFYGPHNRYYGLVGDGFMTPRLAFADLWDSLKPPAAHAWEANPWVWVVKFRRVTS